MPLQTERPKKSKYVPLQSESTTNRRSCFVFLSGFFLASFLSFLSMFTFDFLTSHSCPQSLNSENISSTTTFERHSDSTSFQKTSEPQTFSLPKKPKPKCGILWFYHIPKTGGGSMEAFLEEGADKHHMKRPYPFFHGPDHGRKKSLPEHWKNINNRVDHQKKSRWLLIHHHIHVPPLCNVTQSTEFRKLESRMKKKGCGIYIISILRDPMSQCISSMGENLIDPGYATTYATQYGPLSMGWFFEFFINAFVENMRTPRQTVQSALNCLSLVDRYVYISDIDLIQAEVLDLLGWKPFQSKKKRSHSVSKGVMVTEQQKVEMNRTFLALGHWEFYYRTMKGYKYPNLDVEAELAKMHATLYPFIRWVDYRFVKDLDKLKRQRRIKRENENEKYRSKPPKASS